MRVISVVLVKSITVNYSYWYSLYTGTCTVDERQHVYQVQAAGANKGSVDGAIDHEVLPVPAASHLRSEPLHKQDGMAGHVAARGQHRQPARRERDPEYRYGHQSVQRPEFHDTAHHAGQVARRYADFVQLSTDKEKLHAGGRAKILVENCVAFPFNGSSTRQ